MPVYNEARTVQTVLKRVLDVDFPCPVEVVIVALKNRSAMKMPSAWWRSARWRKSAVMAFDSSNHW